MSTISSALISANRTAVNVEYRLYFDGFHQTAAGLYRGTFPARGEGVFGRPAFLRGDCTESGSQYTIPELTIEPTTNVLKGSTRATLALFDKDTDHLLNIVFQDAEIPASPDPITIAQILSYQIPMARPINFAGSGTSFTSLTLTWAESVDAASFDVEQWTGTAWGSPASVDGDEVSLLVSSLDVHGTYEFRMRAIRADGKASEWTDTISVTTLELPDPEDFAYTLVNIDKIDLTWSDVSGTDGIGIDGTSVEKAVGSGAFSIIATVTNTSGLAHSTGLTKATAYRYRARYYLGSHYGPYTPILTPTTPDIYPPDDFSAVRSGNDVLITYGDPNAYESGYDIHRKTDGGAYSLLHSNAANDTDYTDTAPTRGHVYTYKAKATNAAADSAFSAEVAVTIPLAAPASITVSPQSATAINVTPATVTGADSYTIYRDGVQIATAQTSFPYADTGLTANTSYSYTALAVNAASGAGDLSGATSGLTYPAVPSAPSPSMVSTTAIDIPLPSTGAASYKISRATTLGGSYTEIATGQTGTYHDTGLSAGTQYFYKLKATNATGDSALSSAGNTYTQVAAPGTLTIDNATNTSLDITVPSVTGASSYKIERSANGTTGWTEIFAGVSSFPQTDTGRTAGTTYYYRARATGPVGDGAYSAVANGATTTPPPSTPGTPVAVAINPYRVDVSVSAVSGATSYKWYRQDGGAGSFTLVSGLTTASVSDLTVSPSTAYRYKAVAHNAGGDSSQSTQSNSVTTPSPTPPFILVQDGNGITLSGATGAIFTEASYADQLQHYLDLTGLSYTWHNLSLGGRTTFDQSTDSATINALWSTVNDIYLPFDCGSNDITEQFKTATQALTYLNTLVSNCVAQGFKVILNTLPDRSEFTNPTMAGYRTTVNNAIRAGISGASGYVDLAARSEFQDHTDRRYFYSDGVHWTPALYQIAAQMVGEAICAVNAPDASIISGTVTHNGTPQAGVMVSCLTPTPQFTATAITDGSGNYSLPLLADHAYVVTASKDGYSYPPVTVASLTADQTIDLAGTAISATGDLNWASVTGASVAAGNEITKSVADAWGTGGAASAESFTGDFEVSLTVARVNTQRVFGISPTQGHHYTTMTAAFLLRGDSTIQFIEAGNVMTDGGTDIGFEYAFGQRLALRVVTVSGTRWCEWVVGDVVVRRVSLTTGTAYYVNWDIFSNGASAENVQRSYADSTLSVVVDGNSIPWGYGTTTPYPTILGTELFAAGIRCHLYNFAVSGQTTQQMTTDGAGQVLPAFNVNSVKNVHVFDEIRNDLVNNTLTGTQAYNHIVDYFAAVPDGDLKLVCNCPPNTDITGGLETARLLCNSLIDSNAVSNGWTVVDLAGDSRLDDPSDATYYQDGVHPTDAGAAVRVELIKTPILAFAPPVMRTISGNIAVSGTPVSGVTVTISGDYSDSTTTDGSGNYTIDVPDTFNVVATPSKIGYTFSPTSTTHNNITANDTDDYAATVVNYITPTNIHGGSVDSTAKTYTTSGSAGWNLHGITSTEKISSGQIGAIEFTFRNFVGEDIVIGLTPNTDNTIYSTVQDGLYGSSGAALTYWKSGASDGSGGGYDATEVWKIETYMNSSTWSARLLKNGVQVHDFAAIGSSDLYVAVIVFQVGVVVDLPRYTGAFA